MNLCFRCNHQWKPMPDNAPTICPRCKSKLWNKRKEAKRDRSGNLYVLLLNDGVIKVGRSQLGCIKARMQSYSGIIERKISKECDNLWEAEAMLVAAAVSICGKSCAGREYFNGGLSEFNELSDFIGDLPEGVNRAKDIKEEATYDNHQALMNCQHKTFVEIKTREREQFYLLVSESINDASAGICTYEKALESIVTASFEALSNANIELKEINSNLKVN